MGIFSYLFQGTMQGAGSKDLAAQLYAAPRDGFTPDRPGALIHKRTVPVIQDLRDFSPLEAEALEVEAATRKEMATATKKAYKSLSEIEAADAARTTAHYSYRASVADATLAAKTAHGDYAAHMEGLRPQYASVAEKHFSAAQRADLAAAAVRVRVDALTDGHKRLMATGGHR